MPGEGIGKTVAVIHSHSVTGALTVFPVGIESDVGNAARNFGDIIRLLSRKATSARTAFSPDPAKRTIRASSRLAALI